ESLHSCIALLAIAAGSLLLAVHFYSSPQALIPSTALGVLLLLLSPLLTYAGIRRSTRNGSLLVALCLTLSALWSGYGVILVLAGQGALPAPGDARDALLPGLATSTLALLLLALVGFLSGEPFLALLATAMALATSHEIALHYSSSLGPSAVACGHLLVCLLGGYFALGRILYFLTKGRVALPGTDLAEKKAREQGWASSDNPFVAPGLLLNVLWASVFCCRLLGVTHRLFLGHVPWLWVAGTFQVGICVLSYRAMDVLMATAFGFTAILSFAGGYSLLHPTWQPEEPALPTPLLVVFSILFALLALFLSLQSPVDGLYLLVFVTYCIALACSPRGFFAAGPQGVAVAIFVASASVALIHLYNVRARAKIPTGQGAVRALLARSSFLRLREGPGLHTPYLGYSKYADAEILAYACSVLASFALTATGDPQAPLATVVIPWVVVAGGILKLLSGSVAFARGKTLESSAFILYAVMWIIWGLARFTGLQGTSRSFHAAVGIVAFVLFNSFVIFCSLFLNTAWFFYSLTFMLVAGSFLLDSIGALPAGYDMAASLIFGLVSFYCFLAALASSTLQGVCLPMGKPMVQLSGVRAGATKCLHLPARKASSVKRIADILRNGGTCGIPTDTVYVLVAACSRPDAVEKAHRSKRQAQDRPMSLWISSLKQLEPARHLFTPLLWDFMEAAWPSPISLVIPRGEWLDFLGMKDSAKYVGTPQSVAIRIPDCSVTTHLIDLVGPIVVTSANPTGEADTTHHNQVYAKLGDKVDAVLCGGPSPENIASTVVDCTKIDTGHIGFFRVGIIPKSQVLQILEQVQKK
ncbi:YRDC protein, partial [Catharus fuscescens]|nr:YRDC protein [Catharus fuscescens]